MRKAKITDCVAEMVGIEMTNAATGVEFKEGRYERYALYCFDWSEGRIEHPLQTSPSGWE